MKMTNQSADAHPAFQRRFYQRGRQYWLDLYFLLSRPCKIYQALRHTLSHAFRERLMMVITEVNQCPYCKTFHTRLAGLAGIEDVELQCFSAGVIDDRTPIEERPALNYVRQWAEDNARASTKSRQQLVAIYGKETAEAIDLTARLIWIGNLSGNTWDYCLYRLSFGQSGQ